MKMQIVERKVNLKEATKVYLDEKLGKFNKVFGEEAAATATFYAQNAEKQTTSEKKTTNTKTKIQSAKAAAKKNTFQKS